MPDDDELARWGIQPAYHDTGGQHRRSPDHSLDTVLATLRRGEPDGGPAGTDAFLTRRTGDRSLPGHLAGSELALEDGTQLGRIHALPPDLPVGYHRLQPDDRAATTLAVTPGTCVLPEGLRAWGWSLQLAGARSSRSWGHGDLADAETLGRWCRDQVGGDPLLLLNPLHAPNPVADPTASPYYAGSRCFRNPLYLHVEDVPGASAPGLAEDLAPLAAAARTLNADRIIDRVTVWALKRRALERIWAEPHQPGRALAEQAVEADPVTAAFGAFCAAVEIHGGDWRVWPAELRHPAGTGWGALTRDRADRVAFHVWLQLLLADQLASVQRTCGVLHDLAVGSDPRGFDAWYWQEIFVLDGTRVGAPPDQFNTLGQDWGLPPLDPWRHRAAAFEPFVRMVRGALELGAGARIDHVMGLFRLFWVPSGDGPGAGVYVRQPSSELLDVLAIESARAGGYVVGEDLGTVEEGVRHELWLRRILFFRVLTLEEGPPHGYPEHSLASATTHDLPTLAGLWTGSDLAAMERIGLHPNVDDTWKQRARMRDHLGLHDDATVPEVVLEAHRAVGAAPSHIAMGQLDDVLGVEERPNMPGTTHQWPNWSLALPVPLDELLAGPQAAAVADGLAHPADLPPR